MKRAPTNLAASVHQRLLNDEPAIKFIDGRHAFVTLYKNLHALAQCGGPAKPDADVPARGRVRSPPRFT